MAYVRTTTNWGVNYRGGVRNDSGSHMVGWDARLVRAEVYSFTTGDWPVTILQWWGPLTSLYQGSDIAIRYAISTSETTYVNSYGDVAGSYELIKNDYNYPAVNLQPHTTYYITFFPGISRDSGWGLFNIGEDENWFSVWMWEVDRTACTAPTSLSLSKTIQTPGQNVTLSWSGAKAGTGVSIASYNVYRSTSSGGTYSYLTNTTSTSCNVAAPPATKYYYYKVIAKANIAGYDSGYSNASAGLKGNSPPNAPSVSANRTVVPSYGGSVTFTVTAGTDPDGQTRTLYYSTSSSGTKTLFTSPLTVNLTSAKTYYFYTYDGLAYSAITQDATKPITINDKPEIRALTANAVGTYSALGENGITGSQLGYANTIIPKISTNKQGTITVDLEYYSSDNTTAWDSTSISRATVQNSAISSTTDVILNNYNIHQYISLGTTNIHWRLRFKLTDSLESSDYVYFPSENCQYSGEYYAIARPSPLLASYNQFANSDIIGTITGEIWRNVRLKVYDDTSVPLISAAATVNGAAVAATIDSTTTENGYRYIDIILPDGLDSGATINVTAQMKDSGNSITKNVSTTVTETTLPTLDVLSHGAPSIKPFTDTGTFAISSTWPFGSYETIDSTTLAAYNCDTTVSNVIRFVLSSDSSAEGSNRVVKTLYSPWTKSGDSITASLDKSTIYDWNNSLGITSYSGSRTYYCRIEIENLFEKVISTPWLSRTFDFREPVQSPSITSIEWSSDETNWTTFDTSTDKLQEGIYVRFNCSFGLYTTDEVKVSVLLTNSSGERSVGCYEFGSPTKITPITYLNTELTRASNRTVATNTKSYVYHITTEIADTASRYWRLQFENTGGITSSSTGLGIKTEVTRQCSPDIVFVSCTTDQDYNLTYAYTMTDNGGADTLTNYLCDEVDKAEITSSLSGTSGTIQAKQSYRDWEVKTISIKSVSVVTGLITNTKTYYFNAIIVYQISPTVAYRKNQLGVNTDTPTNGAIIDIHQSTGRETVLIQGLDSSIPPKTTKFEVNVTTGEIKFYLDGTLKNTVDLLNGFLT